MTYDQATLDQMRADARRVQERLQRGGSSAKYISLSGKNAIAPQGGEVIVRILPRWDIARTLFRKRPDGQWERNPDYKPGKAYVPAFEHWWDGPDGKPTRAWCRKVLGEEEFCPVCEAAAALLRGSKEQRTEGLRIQAKEVYLFNVLLRKEPYGADGRPAVKILPVPQTVFLSIIRYITGGEEQSEWTRGDIASPEKGYDVKIIRPSGPGSQYKTDCAPQPSPLFRPDEVERWKGWMALLHDLEAEISGENILSYEQLYQNFFGEAPADGGGEAPQEAEAPPAQDPGGWGAPPPDMTGMPEAGPPPAAGPPTAPQAYTGFEMPPGFEPPPPAAPPQPAPRQAPPAQPAAPRRPAVPPSKGKRR